MALIALKEFVYAGKTLQPGETFEAATPQDARTLVAIKRAKAADAEPETDTKNDKPKGKYKTRKLKAEDD